MTDDAKTSAPEASAPAPAPRFVNTAGRSETVPLEWPIEFDGLLYDSVTVRRMTVADIAAFEQRINEARRTGGDLDKIRFPMFDVPEAVMDALDSDDADRVGEVTLRFLPRRFRGEEGNAPTP